MDGNNYYNSNGAFPILFNSNIMGDSSTKLSHDSYEVYVNRDYIGRKTLLVQGEDVKDVEKHLKSQGFSNFTASVEGCNILIKSDNADAENIKKNLNVYLHIR